MAFHVQSVKKVKTKGKFGFNIEMAGAIPFFLVLLLLVLLPFVFIVIYAFTQSTSEGYLYLTLNNFAVYLSEASYMRATLRSLWFALIATVICLVIGYPVGYFIGRIRAKTRNLLSMLMTATMWVNMLLRILAWRQIFTMMESWFHITILGTDFAIIFGMVYDLLPFMIIPIYTSVMKLDPAYIEAAKDLGASSVRTFFNVIVPLTMPGIISGITMVFLPAATTLVIPDKLGGGNTRYMLIGNLIESYFIKQSNPYVGSAIALLLGIVILLFIYLLGKLDRTVVADRDDNNKRIVASRKGA